MRSARAGTAACIPPSHVTQIGVRADENKRKRLEAKIDGGTGPNAGPLITR